MDFVLWYLSVGVAIWLICFVRDAFKGFASFKEASFYEVMRGFFGVLVWPLIIWMLVA